jgi:hypothetical protein
MGQNSAPIAPAQRTVTAVGVTDLAKNAQRMRASANGSSTTRV